MFAAAWGVVESGPSPDSTFRAQVLADGVVTPSEYGRAVAATLDCITSSGLTAFSESDALGLHQISVESTGREDAVFYSCAERWLDEIELAFGNALQERELARVLASCLSGLSLEPTSDHIEDLLAAVAGTACEPRSPR